WLTVRHDNRNVFANLYDANGDWIFEQYNHDVDESVIQVYRAPSTSTYTLVLEGEGDFTLTFEAGDTVRNWQPPLSPGDTVSGSLDEDELVAFELLIPEDESFTLRMSQDSLPPYVQTYDEGWHASQFDGFDDTSQEWVSVFPGEDSVPFAMTIRGPGAYKITLEAGDTFRDVGSTLALGDTASGTLDGDTVQSYDLNVPAGAYFTLHIDNPEIRTLVVDSYGDYRFPIDFAVDSDIRAVYRADNPPLNLSLEGAGDYTLVLEAGDTLNETGDAPTILTVGSTFTGTINPEQRVIFGIELDEDRDLNYGFTIHSDAYIQWKVLDRDNFEFEPLFESGSEVGLPGQAAYFVAREFENHYSLILFGGYDNAIDYTLSLDTGDTLRQDGGVLAPGQDTTFDPQPGTFPYIRYDLDVAPGEFFTLLVSGADVSAKMRDQQERDIPTQFEASVWDAETQTSDTYYVYWVSANSDD
ncbi:MAG: hypothetical protein KC547_22685, partial [Anaerolineae bacterium]|nr:hypothetical protein [Anaerolineae bacterium]